MPFEHIHIVIAILKGVLFFALNRDSTMAECIIMLQQLFVQINNYKQKGTN